MLMRLIKPMLAAGSIAWLARQLFANRGMVPFIPDIEIFEPQQRALLAWNGEEELLILGTDLHASQPTQVLEVLPLPAEPTVTRGDPLVFDKLEALIRSRLNRYEDSRGVRGPGVAPLAPAGEVTQRAHIGSHDVSVTHLLDAAGFVGWAEGYLASLGAETPTIPAALGEIIHRYIAEGFTWFVFDVVSLGETIVTNDPIQYRFRSPRLFYPMRITKLAAGETSVGLYVLTQAPLGRFTGLPQRRVRSRLREIAGFDTIPLAPAEAVELGIEVAELFGIPITAGRLDPTRVVQVISVELRAWQIEGRLDSFDADLIVMAAARKGEKSITPSSLIDGWLADPATSDPVRWNAAAVLPELERRLIHAWEHGKDEVRLQLLALKRALLHTADE